MMTRISVFEDHVLKKYSTKSLSAIYKISESEVKHIVSFFRNYIRKIFKHLSVSNKSQFKKVTNTHIRRISAYMARNANKVVSIADVQRHLYSLPI